MNINEMYVPKNEVKPLRNNFHMWMNYIHNYIKDQGISFTYMLVGSAKRNLVIRNHNQGFDCDYQIRITANTNDLDAFTIKHLFINALNSVVALYGYKNCEDITSSITIKKVSDDSKIINGYDVVILRKVDDEYEILRNDKKGNKHSNYKFEKLPEMKNFTKNFYKIHGKEMWQDLRETYANKKIKELGPNKTNKKSFQLLHQSVNEVLDRFKV